MKAARYFERRLASGLLLLLVVSILSFWLSSLVPGNYLDEMRLNPQVSRETLAQLRSQYGLDQPLAERYLRWIKSSVRGDFGFSFAYNMPVSSLIRARCRNTILLAATAMFLVWIIAVPLGIATASRGGWLDRVCSLGSSFLLNVPELVVILALLAFAVRTGYIPAGGMISDFSQGSNAWSITRDVVLHMIVPALALALVGLPIVLQHTRTAVKEVLEAPFIKAARGHGIKSSRLLIRHVLPAAANPLISLFGLSIAGLVGTSLLAEVVTGWPGLGPLFVESIFARDFYVVIAIVMLASSFLVIGNLLGDLLLCAADPRIRAE
jgi:peptide/nickel transport system permease protein